MRGKGKGKGQNIRVYLCRFVVKFQSDPSPCFHLCLSVFICDDMKMTNLLSQVKIAGMRFP